MTALRHLVNKLTIASYFNTDYGKEFKKDFAVGDTVTIKLPQRWTIRDGLGYSAQPIDRKTTSVTVDQLFGIDFEWDSQEKALDMERSREEFDKQYIEPAMAQIGQEIDSRAALFAYQNCPNITGVLGTNPTTLEPFAQARQLLIEQACPANGRKIMAIPPKHWTSIQADLDENLNPADEISRLFKEGIIGRAKGFDWYESMSLYSHTAGTWAGAVSVTTTATNGATSLALTCTTGDTFLKGDVFTIASVLAVNPSTRRSTGQSKFFVVTQDATGASSAATVQIYPAVYGPGHQYQNVNRLPTAADALTLFTGTSSPNGKAGINALGFHRDAFALVGVPLEVPQAVEMGAMKRDPETGIGVRFVRAWDQQESKMKNRFDVLLGFGRLHAENCSVRVLGA